MHADTTDDAARAKYARQNKWQAKAMTPLTIRLHNTNDADVLHWLDSRPNKRRAVIDLIRADIAAHADDADGGAVS